MRIYPSFPTCRAEMPTRRAEKLIYEALEASNLEGQILYEVKPLAHSPQLDFAVWIAGVGIFGVQVKGGVYRLVNGEWYLITDRGTGPAGVPRARDLGRCDRHPRRGPGATQAGDLRHSSLGNAGHGAGP